MSSQGIVDELGYHSPEEPHFQGMALLALVQAVQELTAEVRGNREPRGESGSSDQSDIPATWGIPVTGGSAPAAPIGLPELIRYWLDEAAEWEGRSTGTADRAAAVAEHLRMCASMTQSVLD